MRGNKIKITADSRGPKITGQIGDTSKPGTCMQLKTSPAQVADITGNFIWIAAAPGTDGKAVLHAILLEDEKQGKGYDDAYVSGTLCEMYVPQSGEDMNIRLGEVAGTGNTYAIGDRVIIDAEDGIYVPETGSPQETAWQVMEKVTLVAGSSLVWCKKF